MLRMLVILFLRITVLILRISISAEMDLNNCSFHDVHVISENKKIDVPLNLVQIW